MTIPTEPPAAVERLDGSIPGRPRQPTSYPLLNAVYRRHDRLISRWVRPPTLEVACGRWAHPDSDLVLDIVPDNLTAVDRPAVAADVRQLPIADASVRTLIGRRFVHHLPASDRDAFMAEARRVLVPGGCLIVLEGTPGLYRTITKGVGFRLGVLGDDHDIYGHCSAAEVHRRLDDAGFELELQRRLGSVLMPLSILQWSRARVLAPLLRAAPTVRWWTLFVARAPRSE